MNAFSCALGPKGGIDLPKVIEPVGSRARARTLCSDLTLEAPLLKQIGPLGDSPARLPPKWKRVVLELP